MADSPEENAAKSAILQGIVRIFSIGSVSTAGVRDLAHAYALVTGKPVPGAGQSPP